MKPFHALVIICWFHLALGYEENEVLDAINTVFFPKEGKGLEILDNFVEHADRVLESSLKVFSSLHYLNPSSINGTIDKEETEKIQRILSNASLIIKGRHWQQKLNGTVYINPELYDLKKYVECSTCKNTDLSELLSNENLTTSESLLSKLKEDCNTSPGLTLEFKFEYIFLWCSQTSLNFDVIDLMATYIGYKYSEEDRELLNKYTYIYAHLSRSESAHSMIKRFHSIYEKTKFTNQAARLDQFMKHFAIRSLKLWGNCVFDLVLVNNGFKRAPVEGIALILAQEVVNMCYETVLCASLIREQEENIRYYLDNHFKQDLQQVTNFLQSFPSQILNSTWLSVQSRHIKELIVEHSVFQPTNVSFGELAEKIYKQQNQFGLPSYEVQILVTPYSSEDIEQNKNFWYFCQQNACQLFQLKNKFNVIAFRIEKTRNSSQLQKYIDSIKPTIMKAFEKKYSGEATPRKVVYSLKHQDDIDLTTLEHHQGVVILRSKSYFSPCHQKMAFYQSNLNQTNSILF